MSDAGVNDAVIFFNQDELRQLCSEWQRILRLQDWDVVVRISRRDEDLEGCEGRVKWRLSKKQALIKILDPIDYSADVIYPQDMESTLVHELLHLHFALFDADEGTPAATAQEQAIEAIAKGLVWLKRSRGKEAK